MSQPNSIQLEIAHVLFMDIVGYSRLLIDEQTELVAELNSIVSELPAVKEAERKGNLIRLPTGDGMALVFSGSLDQPVQCAVAVSKALRNRPQLQLRTGIHT